MSRVPTPEAYGVTDVSFSGGVARVWNVFLGCGDLCKEVGKRAGIGSSTNSGKHAMAQHYLRDAGWARGIQVCKDRL